MSDPWDNDADDLAFIESKPALDIKEEHDSNDALEIDEALLEDLLVQKKSRSKKSLRSAPIIISASSFCILCLRKCPPGSKVTFQSNSESDNGIDVIKAKQKVVQALGVQKDLLFRAMCLTCWQLIELITDFQQCCEKTTKKLKVFLKGIDCDQQEDPWMAKSMLDTINSTRRMIREHMDQLDEEETKMKQAVRQNRTRKQQPKASKVQEVAPAIDHDEVHDVQKDAQEEETESSHLRTSAAEELSHDLENDKCYKVNILTCEICSRNFDGENALRVHKTHCKPDAPMTGKFFSCPICTATFNENCGLTFHLNKHKGIRPYKCRKFCNNTFFSNFTRIKHERKYCEKEGRVCDICGTHLKNEASLVKHTETVHGEAKHPCNVCGRQFRSKKTLRLHKRVHSEERKYVCTVCNKAYKAPFSLKIHMRIHTQELPFPCSMCERVFNYKVSLKNHVERYHGP